MRGQHMLLAPSPAQSEETEESESYVERERGRAPLHFF